MQPDSPEGMLVLITGACGVVGTILRYHWRAAGMTLRLADLTEPEELLPHESFMRFDLLSDSDCRRVCEGVHTIVHLAADAGSEDFLESLLPKNVVGPYQLLEAAVSSGVSRVVLTSSIYAVRGFGPDPPITTDRGPCPEGLYGATKAWLEALGRVYSDTHGLSCVIVRLGNPRMEQANERQVPTDLPSYALTPRDCAQLFEKAVKAELRSNYVIVHGSSAHKRMFLDIGSTREMLGYTPQDGTTFPRISTGDLTFRGRM